MPITKAITVFRFAELNTKAKENALKQGAELFDDWMDFNDVLRDLFVEQLKPLGYPIDDIRYSLSCCQGDGVAFYGKFDAKPVLERLCGIANAYDCQVEITCVNHHYNHYNSMGIDFPNNYTTGEFADSETEIIADAILQDIRETSKMLEGIGYKLLESIEKGKPESIADLFEANDYWFFSNGDIVPAVAFF